MIVYRKGDLTKSGANVLIHGCNCHHTMGSGVAQALRAAWPKCYTADIMQTKIADGTKMGSWSSCGKATPEEPLIINLYTQYNYGTHQRQLNYEAVATGMLRIARRLEELDHDMNWRIAMPRIGAGLAGGDWNIIELMINGAFEDRKVEVWVL